MKLLKKSLVILLLIQASRNAQGMSITWHGTNVVDVTDQNVELKGSIDLPATPISVHAIDKDIDIDLSHKVSFKASADGDSTLNLIADAGRNILVHIDEKLVFKNNGMNKIILNESGCGTITFIIKK